MQIGLREDGIKKIAKFPWISKETTRQRDSIATIWLCPTKKMNENKAVSKRLKLPALKEIKKGQRCRRDKEKGPEDRPNLLSPGLRETTDKETVGDA